MTMSPRSQASLAALLLAVFACQSPSVDDATPHAADNPKPTPRPNPAVVEEPGTPEQVGGSQVGDDGSASPPLPPCFGGMSGIGDLDTAIDGHTSTPSEWRAGLTSEQTGVATLRYPLASGQLCVLEMNYALTTEAESDQLWSATLTSEVADGKCVAQREYVIEDVSVELEFTDVFRANASLVGMTNTPKQGPASSTLGAFGPGVPTPPNNPSRYRFSEAGLEALCAANGVISDPPSEPPSPGDGGWITVIPGEAAVPPTPYVGASCIECLRHSCDHEVEQCEAAANCSVFTECAAGCDEDPECSGACPDPFCDTGNEPGCSLMDCRNWICDEVCGQPPFGQPNQVYEQTDAGSELDSSVSAEPEPEARGWRDVDPNVFTLTRTPQDGTWTGSLEVLRLEIEF